MEYARNLKRAIFLSNNPRLQNCVRFIPLPAGSLANMTPFMLPAHEVQQWAATNHIFKVQFDQLRPEVQEIYTTLGPTSTHAVSQTALRAKSEGAAVGMDDGVRVTGYKIGMVDVASSALSGYVSAAGMTTGKISALLNEITVDAVRQFGPGVVCSNKAVNLSRVQKFIRAHPKYAQMMRCLEQMPGELLPEVNVAETLATTKAPYTTARFFRKQIFMPSLKPYAANSMGTIKSALNSSGKVIRIALRGTCVVPIVLGVANVADAPPELRMQTLFEQGLAVVGGFAGSYLGSIGGVTIAAFLCLGPLGLFVSIFLCTTVTGFGFGKLGEIAGSKLYAATENYDGRYFLSLQEVLGAQ